MLRLWVSDRATVVQHTISFAAVDVVRARALTGPTIDREGEVRRPSNGGGLILFRWKVTLRRPDPAFEHCAHERMESAPDASGRGHYTVVDTVCAV